MSEVVINIHDSAFRKLLSLPLKGYKRTAKAWHEALASLKPSAQTQYVKILDTEAATALIELGLLKKTNRKGSGLYVVPKTIAFATLEPSIQELMDKI